MEVFKKVAFISFLIFSLFACKMDLAFESNENFEDEISTSITFYSCEDGGSSSPVTLSKRLYQGERYTSGQLLTSAELSSLGNTGDFLGYKFYRKTGTAETAIPNYVFPDSQGFISSIVITTDSIDIIAYFGNSYRVNHFLQNIDGYTYPSTPYLTQTFSAEAGENSNAQALSGSDIAGFTYDSSSSDSLVQPVASDGSTVINLYYTRNLIYLTVNLNGGNIGGNYENIEISGLYGASVETVEDPEYTGKTFSGWKNSANEMVSLPSTFPAEDQTFTALWDAVTYTMTFNLNGGYINSSNASIVRSGYYGTAVTAVEDPTRSGYSFTGWKDSDTDIVSTSIPATFPAENKVYTAQWTPVYSITYVLNGGSWNSGYTAPDSYTSSDSVTLPGSANVTQIGYDFASWHEDESFTGEAVTSIESGTTGNKTFYAKWTPRSDTAYTVKHLLQSAVSGSNEYTEDESLREISYGTTGDTTAAVAKTLTGFYAPTVTQTTIEADGSTVVEIQYTRRSFTLAYADGVDDETISVPANGTYRYGATVNVRFTPLGTRAGYTFAGWSDGTDTYTSDGTTSFTMPASNVPLTAQWTIIEYTITYNLDGGTNNVSNPAAYTIKSPDIEFADPSKTGDYIFGGWYTDLDDESTKVETIESGSIGNKTLYAKWLPVYATITAGGVETKYGTKADTINAIAEATGDIEIVLTSNVTSSDLGSASSSGTICYAIKNTNADTVTLSVASGQTIALTSCMNMFNGCTKLVSADLRGFNTSNVTNMLYMFTACTSLSTLNISTFDFSKVSYISAMFRGCTALTSLDGVNFACKPSSTTEMFKGCSALSALDISALDTSIATSMDSMFEDCSSLTELDVSGFNTEKVTNMQRLFKGCKKLTSLNLSNFNTADVTKMGLMFYQCEKLTDLNLASFDTSKVAEMPSMFYSCKEVTSITVSSNFVTDAVTSSSGMFMNCSKLVGGAGTPYSSEHTDAEYAHIDGGTFYPGYFTSNHNYAKVGDTYYENISDTVNAIETATGNITVELYKGITRDDLVYTTELGPIPKAIADTGADSVTLVVPQWANIQLSAEDDCMMLFVNCTKLISADLKGFNTEGATYMDGLFSGCTSLQSFDISTFNVSNVTSVNCMFENCSSLTEADISIFGTVQKTAQMFSGCSSLRTIYATSSFNVIVSMITDAQNMFNGCTSLVGGAGTTFDSTKVNNSYARIDGGSSSPGYFTAAP